MTCNYQAVHYLTLISDVYFWKVTTKTHDRYNDVYKLETRNILHF